MPRIMRWLRSLQKKTTLIVSDKATELGRVAMESEITKEAVAGAAVGAVIGGPLIGHVTAVTGATLGAVFGAYKGFTKK